jgi:NAD(P)-dependent dehydrogenase (short-subunit alcohol dehydrogenase family)
MRDLAGKVAFVTGAGSGIGLALSAALADAGMRVVLADLRQDHLAEAMEQLRTRALDDKVHPIAVDVTDRRGLIAAADEAERVFGTVQVLVNNAGIGIEVPFSDASPEDWDLGLAVNLGGVINGLHTFLPRMRANGRGGHVVNTASLAALVTMPAYLAIYATSKAAVAALTDAIRGELAQDHIGVTLLCPGPVKSRIHELGRNTPRHFELSPALQDAARKLSERQVSPLWMEPAEVARRVLDAIRNDDPYVITHGEWRPMVIARHEAYLAAMPERVDPALIASLKRS